MVVLKPLLINIKCFFYIEVINYTNIHLSALKSSLTDIFTSLSELPRVSSPDPGSGQGLHGMREFHERLGWTNTKYKELIEVNQKQIVVLSFAFLHFVNLFVAKILQIGHLKKNPAYKSDFFFINNVITDYISTPKEKKIKSVHTQIKKN